MSGRKDLGADWAASSGRKDLYAGRWYSGITRLMRPVEITRILFAIFPQLGALGDSQSRGRAPYGARGCACTTLLPLASILLLVLALHPSPFTTLLFCASLQAPRAGKAPRGH